jgi:hypothetical protein
VAQPIPVAVIVESQELRNKYCNVPAIFERSKQQRYQPNPHHYQRELMRSYRVSAGLVSSQDPMEIVNGEPKGDQ